MKSHSSYLPLPLGEGWGEGPAVPTPQTWKGPHPLPPGERTETRFTRRSPSAECGTAIRLTDRTRHSTFVLYEHSEQTETHAAPTSPWPAQLSRPAQAPTPLRRSDQTITRLRKTDHPSLAIPCKTLDFRLVPLTERISRNAIHAGLPAPRVSLPQTDKTITRLCKIEPPQSHDPPQNTGNPSLWASWKKFPRLARSVVHRAALRPHASRTPPNGSEQDRTCLPNRRPNPTEQSRTPPNASNALLAAPQTPTRRSTCLRGSWS